MSGGSIIRAVDYGNDVFQRTFQKLKPDVQKKAKAAFGQLTLLDMACAPAGLHLHTLTSKKVPSRVDSKKTVSVYTIHITPDDKWKASFTFEQDTAYLRACGEHDWLDDNP